MIRNHHPPCSTGHACDFDSSTSLHTGTITHRGRVSNMPELLQSTYLVLVRPVPRHDSRQALYAYHTAMFLIPLEARCWNMEIDTRQVHCLTDFPYQL